MANVRKPKGTFQIGTKKLDFQISDFVIQTGGVSTLPSKVDLVDKPVFVWQLNFGQRKSSLYKLYKRLFDRNLKKIRHPKG